MSEEKKAQTVQVKIDEATAQGTYVNLAVVSHTETEFILDFVFVQPGRTSAKVQSRVIVNPRQAKRIAATLTDAVSRYEELYGDIPDPVTQTEGLVH